MVIYGPQYRTRQDAEQDANLARARGQKAEVWECHRATSETASAQARYDDALIRLDVLHLVVSALAAKADVSNEKLLGLFREAEEELRAKRWLT